MLNKAILMGRLTADPELRRTQNNTAVTSFTLAVNRSFAKQGEQAQTDFIDCVAWQNTAEFVSKWFKKGMLVAVCGRIQTRMWEDKNAQKRKSVEVIVEEANFAEPKRDSGNQQMNSERPAPTMDMGEQKDSFAELSDEDGELPF